MLQIHNVRKEYRTGPLVQKALDGVSLNLRDNEFVAILGPSGSGKTTLLNIIGGLDRYDSGDLIINGISTKKYKDRDWDSYRNHTIGFVFQSYNLIMHQTVLSNVELALTISGISGAERRERAIRALEKVGLGQHIHKKPNQMSGGQMQRVAIARALVNDPDIVLADEPTGALDSETSVQVMDLLKEVAKDRLVVMVTHNPELAQQYATRIVNISDGHIVGDTDPFVLDPAGTEPPVHKNLGKASMSFLTALSLSFNNLKTKKARTFMVSFAGSIGIIGIALILALSSGVNQYIKTQEAETLSEYPLQIDRTGYDLTSFMTGGSGGMFGSSEKQEIPEGKVGVAEFANTMFDGVKNNDLGALRTYLESGESQIYDYVNSIEYNYDITPQIYRIDGEDTYQLNPNNMFSSLATGSMDISSMMSGTMGTSIFNALPEEQSLYADEYDVKAGHWPEKNDELVLVLTSSGKVSDILLYDLGLKDQTELQKMIDDFIGNTGKQAQDNKDSEKDTETKDNNVVTDTKATSTETESVSGSSASEEPEYYDYDQFLGQSFRLVNSYKYYEYDAEYKVWTNKSDNKSFVKNLARDGRELKIVGIVQPKEDVKVTMLMQGIGYPHALIHELMTEAADSEVVKAQLANEKKNIFTGKRFDAESDSEFDMSKLFSVDEDAIANAFKVDTSALDPSSMENAFSGLSADNMNLGNIDFSQLNLGSMMDEDALQKMLPSSDTAVTDALKGIKIELTDAAPTEMENLLTSLVSSYDSYAAANGKEPLSKLGKDVSEYLNRPSTREALGNQMNQIIQDSGTAVVSQEEVNQLMTQVFDGYQQYLTERAQEDPTILSPDRMAPTFQEYLNSAGVQQMIVDFVIASGQKMSAIFTEDKIAEIVKSLADGYQTEIDAGTVTDPAKLGQDFVDYMGTAEAQKLVTDATGKIIKTDVLQESISKTMEDVMKNISSALGTQLSTAMQQIMGTVMNQIAATLTQAMTNVMSSMSSSMADMFQIDPNAFANAITTNMDATQIQELMNSMMSGTTSSYEGNLTKLGYADPESPSSINIYSKDFDSKSEVTAILDAYNQKMEDAGDEEKVITYTDMVATMMTSVTDIINAISYVLIAFVGISLVVSSIMIGVITYISVLERRKEIGILRAIGASKNNVAQVFNAETFITGFLAGTIGVIVSFLLTFPINHIIYALTEEAGIKAYLPIGAAFILIILSIVLTMIAGLLPSRKASKSDPVTALRTE